MLDRVKSPVSVTNQDASVRSGLATRRLPSNRRLPRSEEHAAVSAGDGAKARGGGEETVSNPRAESGSDSCVSSGSSTGVATEKPLLVGRGSSRGGRGAVRGVVPWLRRFRAFAGVAFVVMASAALAWGVEQHVKTSPRFAVKSVRVDGTSRRTPEQITESAGISIGVNIFAVDLELARRRLLDDPWIASADVERHLPSSLSVVVVEREASAVVVVDADLYLSTPDGELFKRLDVRDPIGLLVINGLTSSLVAADRKLAASRVRAALELAGLYNLQSLVREYPIQEVKIGDDGTLRLVVGRDAIVLEMGRGPYRRKVQRAVRVLREVQKQKAEASIIFLDNEAHPERVVVRMR